MTTLIKEVYDAFRAAGTPEEQAAAAAQAMAGYEDRFTRLEHRMVALEGRLTLLQWMVGINSAGIALIIGLVVIVLRALP